MQLPALAAAHGDAQWLHVQAAAGLLFMLHLRLRHRGREGAGAGLQGVCSGGGGQALWACGFEKLKL